jgi:hypothetical protein
LPWRIDSLLIDQQCIDNATHLDELLPVAAVAGKARDLPRRYCANLAETDLRHHTFESNTGDAAGCRATKVVIDCLDLRPAQFREPIPHGVLKRAALTVVQDLMNR